MHLLKAAPQILYNVCFLALSIALTCDLFIQGPPEKLFYLVSYVAIAFTLHHAWQFRHQKAENYPLLWLMLALCLMAIARGIWGYCFKATTFTDIRENYVLGGKRYFLTAFTVFYFYKARHLLTRPILTAAIVIIVAGLCYTLWQGLHAHSLSDPRIKLTADAATTASYLTVLVSMTCLYMVFQRFGITVWSLLGFFAIFSLNIYLIILTETRAAVIITPLLYVLFFITYYTRIHKTLLYGCIIIFVVAILGTPYAIWDRMRSIQTDVATYQINNDTSIGARFSIWKSGWHSVKISFIGQSSDDRTTKARQYIEQHEKHNPEAWKNVAYHLHNEMLEVFSLQGILGLGSLLAFYLSGFIYAFSRQARRSAGVMFIILPCFLFGLADTALIQSNTSLLVCISLSLMMSRLCSATEKNAATPPPHSPIT
ncbi:MAG: O-antigen ligase [Candidatus Erwinia impunctatus]|nr:O-antigen ligase [Culicoides impunctatus]